MYANCNKSRFFREHRKENHGFHLDRTFGGDCHYRHSGRNSDAGRGQLKNYGGNYIDGKNTVLCPYAAPFTPQVWNYNQTTQTVPVWHGRCSLLKIRADFI